MTSISDPTTSTEFESQGSRPLAIGAVVLILALLAGGGWYAYREWFAGPRESAELDVGNIPDRYRVFGNPAAQRAAPQRAELQKDGVHPFGVGFFRVKSGDFYATLAPAETTFAPMQVYCTRGDLMTQQNRVILRLCNESVNAGFAKSINLTPDQLKKLAGIRQTSSGGMKIEDADRDKLRALWKDWNTAKGDAKNAAQTALLAGFQEVGTRSVEPSRKQYTDLAAEIRKIITDDQLKAYRAMRGG